MILDATLEQSNPCVPLDVPQLDFPRPA
jgi:hypothetical protein